MILSYRTRRFLRALAIVALCLILAAVAVWLVWLLWLDRYVVYTRDGVKLDFSLSAEALSGVEATPPEPLGTITIYYNDNNEQLEQSTELAMLNGYYIDESMLSDISDVRSQIQALPDDTPVMLDVKDIFGYSFYSSKIAPVSESVDHTAMDSLIQYVTGREGYSIARLPAFRDRYYGLNFNLNGIPHISGGYLWMDEEGCYWLDPQSSGTRTYLIQLAEELRDLGFDEVVFTEFRIPDSTEILFERDEAEVLNETASYLVTSCATDTFAVSFSADPAVVTPQNGRSRLYVEDVSAADAQAIAAATGLEDPSIRLVFVVDSSDTRFEGFSTLRPVDFAYVEED